MDLDIAQQVANEAKSLRLLPKCWALLSSRGYVEEGTDIRLYLDYAPHGDLWTLAETYHQLTDRQIPEAFIWYTFLALSDAIFIMNTGRSGDPMEQAGKTLTAWRNGRFKEGILHHRDIKLDSMYSAVSQIPFDHVVCALAIKRITDVILDVFLGPARPPYMCFPTPKLADFDLALWIPNSKAKDEEFMDDLRGGGTVGFQAPEVTTAGLKYPLSAKTGTISLHY